MGARTASAAASENKKAMLVNKEDIGAARNEYLFRVPGVGESNIVGHLMWNILLVHVPLVIVSTYLQRWGPLVALFNAIMLYDRYILGLHYNTHRSANALTSNIASFLTPLYGIPWGCYRLHHVLMHHRENNLFPRDLSSTEPYNRGSFLEWCRYFGRYILACWVELPIYAASRKLFRVASLAFLGGTSTAAAMVYGLCYDGPLAYCMLWFVAVPYIYSSTLLMLGNWGQHIFIHPDHPRNNFHLTYCCINTSTNQRRFNDGYHTLHHLFPGAHWTTLPTLFTEQSKRISDERSLVFNDIDFGGVAVAVFLGQFEQLAKRLVDPELGRLGEGGPFESVSAAVDHMKMCLQPIPAKQ